MATLSLTFLAPGAGIAAAAIAGPLLLLLYFLKLKRRPMRVSTTLFWEQASADLQVNAPFRWLRVSWLLFVQAILLALMALALARPAIEMSGAPANRLALVIDRSASASAQDGASAEGVPQSRLQDAQDRALEIVDRLPTGARAMIVTFARRAEMLTTLTGDRALLRRAIRSITPSDEEGHVATALAVLGPALAGVAGESNPQPSRIVLISDGAFPTSTVDSGVRLGEVEFDFIRVGPAQDAPRDNVGIVALAARRDYDDPSVVRLFVRTQSTSVEPVDVGLSCLLDGVAVASAPLRIPGAADEPGDAAHTFEFSAPEGGLATVSLVRSDRLASDDTSAIFLKRPRAPRILLVQPNVPADLVDYLPTDALAALQPEELRVVTLGEYESLSPEQRSSYHLVVFDRSRPGELPAQPSISFGAGVPIPGLRVAAFDDDDPAGRPTTFAFWQRSHPVMRYVAPGGIPIAAPMQITLDADLQNDGSLDVVTLASGGGGPLITLIERAGVRRLIIAFELGASRWWQDASFPVFLKNAVDYLTLSGDEYAGVVHQPGDTVSVTPAAGVSEILVEGPVSFSRQVHASGRVVLGPFPLAGVYRATGAVAAEATIAVGMLSPHESAIATRDQVILGGESIDARGVGATAPREIWHWLILAALCLLAIEWTLYAWRMRV